MKFFDNATQKTLPRCQAQSLKIHHYHHSLGVIIEDVIIEIDGRMGESTSSLARKIIIFDA